LEDTPISTPASHPVYSLKLYRVDYYHPQIGNDYALEPGHNEKEAYEAFKKEHDDEYKMLSIALDLD
jgi:hypothetical protein